MADNEQSAQERTEEATPKRRDDSRRKGQVARSRELTTTALLLAAASGMLTLGPSMYEGIADIMVRNFQFEPVELSTPDIMWLRLRGALFDAAQALAGFFVLVIVAAMLAPLALGGWSASADQVTFKWEKLDPIKGLKRVFSMTGLLELLKAMAKFFLITGTALLVLWLVRGEVIGLTGEALHAGISHGAQLISMGFLTLARSLSSSRSSMCRSRSGITASS